MCVVCDVDYGGLLFEQVLGSHSIVYFRSNAVTVPPESVRRSARDDGLPSCDKSSAEPPI